MADTELKPEELSYFESGGDTDALAKADPNFAGEKPADPNEAAADPASGAGADAAKPATPAATPASPDPDEVELAPDGRPKNPGKYVPQGALHQERERRKALEAQIGTLQQTFHQKETERAANEARLAERLDILSKALSPAPQEPAKPPTPEEDIFGYVKHLEERVARAEGRTSEVATESAEERTFNALKQGFMADARSYAAQQADFPQAYQHLIKARDQQLADLGYDDAKERAAIINIDERSIVERALKAGRSPSAALYGLSKSMGWVAPATNGAAQPAANNGAASASNGAAPAPNGNGSTKPSVADEMARLQAGQAAARSLSGGGGVPPSRLPSPQELANMNEAQFEALLKSISPEKAQQLLSGFDA